MSGFIGNFGNIFTSPGIEPRANIDVNNVVVNGAMDVVDLVATGEFTVENDIGDVKYAVIGPSPNILLDNDVGDDVAIRFNYTAESPGTSFVQGLDVSSGIAGERNLVISRGSVLGTNNAISIDGKDDSVTIDNIKISGNKLEATSGDFIINSVASDIRLQLVGADKVVFDNTGSQINMAGYAMRIQDAALKNCFNATQNSLDVNPNANSATTLAIRSSDATQRLTVDTTAAEIRLNYPTIIDETNAEALLVRKNADAGDVFIVNTSVDATQVNGRNITKTDNVAALTVLDNASTTMFSVDTTSGTATANTAFIVGTSQLSTGALSTTSGDLTVSAAGDVKVTKALEVKVDDADAFSVITGISDPIFHVSTSLPATSEINASLNVHADSAECFKIDNTIPNDLMVVNSIAETIVYDTDNFFNNPDSIASSFRYYYQEQFTSNVSGAFASTGPFTWNIIRIGNAVQISMPEFSIAATASDAIFVDTVLPTYFRPAFERSMLIAVEDAGIDVLGYIFIEPDGQMTYLNGLGGSTFTGAGNAGCPREQTISYNLGS